MKIMRISIVFENRIDERKLNEIIEFQDFNLGVYIILFNSLSKQNIRIVSQIPHEIYRLKMY